MREKKLYAIFTFSRTVDAMAAEKICTEEKVPGRLIPLPTAISAQCGLAWRTEPEYRELCQSKILKYDSIYSLKM